MISKNNKLLLSCKKRENILFYGCFFIAFVFLCLTLYDCFFNYIWFDEVFSLYIIENSYAGVITQTALDVHPPFYYFILKIAVDLVKLFCPSVNVIVLSKIISMLSAIITFYFCYYVLSKEFNKTISSVFVVLFFALNGILDLTTEIRMYGYCSLFLVLCFYYATKIIRYNKTKDWVFLTIFFVCAAYSHNYSLIASAAIVAYLLLYHICHRRKDLKKAILFTTLMAALYIPWLVVLIKQITTIHGNYWIGETPIHSILKYAFFFNLFDASYDFIFVFVILFNILNIIILVINIRSKVISLENKWTAGIGLFSTSIVFAFGIIFSVLVDPIFIERYTNCVVAVYYLSVIYNFYLFFKTTTLNCNRWFKYLELTLTILSIICFTFCSIKNITSLIKDNLKYERNSIELNKLVNDESVNYIVMDNIMAQEVFEYTHRDKDVYCLNEYDCYGPHADNFKHKVLTFEEISDKITLGNRILYLSTSKDFDKFKDNNLDLKMIGSANGYIVGMDNVVIYELENLEG